MSAHSVLKRTVPEVARPQERAVVAWLDGWLSLFKVGGVTLSIGVVIAVGWAWCYRGAVQLVPFEGTAGAAASLRLVRALDAVALGSTSGMDIDPSLQLASDGGPPSISIPGAGVSFASLVSFVQIGPLAQTRVQGALADQDKTYQVWLQVHGPRVGERTIRTDAVSDPDQALVLAAEQLYGVLKPIVRASYLYSRDAQSCLAVVRELLSDPHASPEDKAAAYRLWGLVLRDQQDFDGAREMFQRAVRQTPGVTAQARRSNAHTWVDLGHTYLWERRWSDAVAAYATAASLDKDWAVPHNFLGDVYRESGDAARALREYQAAIDLDPLYVEPWNGTGRTYLTQQRYDEAIEAYTKARRLDLRRDRTAALTYYGLGDTLFELGCRDAASAHYDRAAEIDPVFQEVRPDWAPRLACVSSRSTGAGAPYSWRPSSSPTAHGQAPCPKPDASEPYADGVH